MSQSPTLKQDMNPLLYWRYESQKLEREITDIELQRHHKRVQLNSEIYTNKALAYRMNQAKVDNAHQRNLARLTKLTDSLTVGRFNQGITSR